MSTSSAAHRSVSSDERLFPTVGWWTVFVVLGLSFGIILIPLGPLWAMIGGALGLALVLGLVIHGTPRVAVVDRQLIAGRARIDTSHLGAVEVLTPEEWSRAMGQDYQPLNYHCTRGWIGQGIRVHLTDPEDPTPAWVISSRQPEQLAAAIETQR